MKPIRDPEHAELEHLVSICPLTGMKVLEIGCGDGALTQQYSGMVQQVVGIDPAASDLLIAKGKTRFSASFIQSEGEKLPFAAQFFDIALFASSL